MLKWLLFTLLHVLALLLAATAFTVVTAPFGRWAWTCTFYEYAYQNGWGYLYHSDYSLPQVLTYLLAYGSGMVLYPLVTRPRFLAKIAAVICAAGFLAFALELSHWCFDHHLSLILSLPAVLWSITLWSVLYAAYQAHGRQGGRLATNHPGHQHPQPI